MIRQEIIERFDKDLRKGCRRDQVNEVFAETSTKLYNEAFGNFKKHATDLIFEGSGWGDQVLAHQNDVNQQMKSLIANAREKEIDKLQVLTQQAAKNNIEEIINTPIYELNPTFWEEIRTPYLAELHDLSLNCEMILKSKLHCVFTMSISWI